MRIAILKAKPPSWSIASCCDIDARSEESEYGKIGWVMDPEGNRVGLWEPPPAPGA